MDWNCANLHGEVIDPSDTPHALVMKGKGFTDYPMWVKGGNLPEGKRLYVYSGRPFMSKDGKLDFAIITASDITDKIPPWYEDVD